MHGVFKEFLFVFAYRPSVGTHLLAVDIEVVGIVELGVGGHELTALLCSDGNDFGVDVSGKLTGLAENHVPDVVGNHGPPPTALLHLHDIGEGKVLHILTEGGNECGISHLRPYVGHLIEEFHKELVGGEFGLTVLLLPFVQACQVVLKVGHQRPHHASGQSGLDEQRIVQVVEGGDIVSEEVVAHFLNEGACLHVCLHVDFLHLETGILEHLLHGNDIGVSGSPRKGTHAHVHIVAPVFADLEYGGHAESGAGMSVILYGDIGVLGLDAGTDAPE